MDLDIFLKPVPKNVISNIPKSLGSICDVYVKEDQIPDLIGKDVIIIGVEEDRASVNNEGCASGPNPIRSQLYRLFPNFNKEVKIVDLGNIKPGKTIKDTYFAVSEVVSYLVRRNHTVILLGGSQDLTYANYLAYEKLEQVVNLVAVDEKFDMTGDSNDINSENFLNKIILHQPNYLFNYSNLGYQSYFEHEDAVELMARLHFDVHRLGEINKSHLPETEPTFRNGDIASFDISAIRCSDAPGNGKASPNGLYGEEFCQLARYAGLSDKISSVGFYEYNPGFDRHEQTSKLVAQAIWYFIDGFYSRKHEYPVINSDQFLKFRVIIEEESHEIVFYKSLKSDRWWMDVPYPNSKSKYSRHHLVPCSYDDYKKACDEDIPDRWWKTFQKLL